MPRYRFVAEDGMFDETEIELPNDEEASREAQRALADLAKDALPDGEHMEMSLRVEAEGRGKIYHASLIFSGRFTDSSGHS